MPLVSVITPAYNAAAFIGDAIRSVQAQSFQEWEMIVVDDCSGDGTGAVVERFASEDPRIRLIRRAENGGSAASRNIALKAATGRYIAFLDADDLWLPEKLERQLYFMQENACGVSYHAYRRFTDLENPGRLLRGPDRVTFDTLLKKTCIGMLKGMIDRDRVQDIRFNTDLRRREDLALWLSVTKAGHDVLFLDEDLARYRITPNAKSSAIFKSAWGTWQVYRKAAGLTIRQTFAAMTFYGFFAVLKRIG